MISFQDKFYKTDWNSVSQLIISSSKRNVERALNREGAGGLEDFAALLSPLAGKEYLEEMAQLAHRLTLQRFGKVVRLFAPMYLSNECNNVCDYCGFSLGNEIPRKTLSVAEILREAGALRKDKFEHVLLVTGESSQKVGLNYLFDAIKVLNDCFANVSMEVQPLAEEDYSYLIEAGLHAVLVYQETYETGSYAEHHKKGKKTNFNWRLNTPDRLGRAGINKIGLGCLYGLTEDWRTDSFFAAMHLDYLEKKYWKTAFSMSFPRIRPYEGEMDPVVELTDRNLVQLLCAYRIFNHELELSLSTRESSALREQLLPIGITTMSAGSKTNPGGYSGNEDSLEQFSISDERSPAEIAKMLKSKGYEPVWKDWDSSYHCRSQNRPFKSLSKETAISDPEVLSSVQ
ncbi:2-iminoacetate synthase ThiH [Opitutales bacterium]|nr:2-iminoacetate synthase ThiH [Opitutales bacterium]